LRGGADKLGAFMCPDFCINGRAILRNHIQCHVEFACYAGRYDRSSEQSGGSTKTAVITRPAAISR
jgi:hypothetical protein